MSGQHCGHHGCLCPDPAWPHQINSAEELAELPHLSVVQFRRPGLGAKNRLVWQLDEEWFSAGDPWSMPSSAVPPQAFPAVVIWTPAAP